MSRSRKAEKRQKKKEKKRLQEQQKLAQEKVKFDIISLLQNEQLDTKPNMAKFLKTYVSLIRCLANNSKIQFYPSFKYDLSKVFVKFSDGHDLIFDMVSDGKFTPKYYLSYNLDEEQIRDKDLPAIQLFFERLIQFKFIF